MLDVLLPNSLTDMFVFLVTSSVFKHLGLHMVGRSRRKQEYKEPEHNSETSQYDPHPSSEVPSNDNTDVSSEVPEHGDNIEPGAQVTAIYWYPVKSCKALRMSQVECGPAGLLHEGIYDRQWMVTDNRLVYLSGKDDHSLVLVQPSFHGDQMYLDAPGMSTLRTPIEASRESPVITAKVYGVKVEAVDCGGEAGQWFSRYLGKPDCHLVVRTDWLQRRKVQDGPTQWHKLAKDTDHMGFQRESPFILGSEASVEDLNSRMDQPVSILNFRPNIVVSGCKAYDEDTWSEIHIGSARFSKMKCIQRCPFTTVDPDKGVVSGAQPLKALKDYRVMPEWKSPSPSFCISLLLARPGTIHEGDTVSITRDAPTET